MINLLYQTYLIVLPIILGYIIWLLKEQKQKQINDAKARDERIQEEYKKRDANCDGTKALLKIGLYEYHDKYVELGYIPSYAYENFCDMYEAYHALGGNGTGTKLYEEIKALHSENEKLKSKLANDSLGDVMNQVKEVNGVKFLAAKVDGVDMNGLRNLGDQLKEKLGEGVVLIASVQDGKVNLMASATDEAQKKGAHAGNLIKAIASLVGGGGGGRPNMAQAGGKNPAGVEEALKKAEEVIASQIQ